MNVYTEKIKQKKEEIMKQRQNLELEKESWNKLFIEEKTRLEREIELLQKFKKNQLEKQIKSNEEEKIAQIKDEYDSKDIKSEIENLKSLYNTKLSQIENQKKLLEEEKLKFEKYKSDMNNNLEIKKKDIEQKKFELLQQNSEINKRYNDMRIKEAYLNDKYEDYIRIKNVVEMKEKQNFQYEKDIKLAGERIQEGIKELNLKENLLEKQKIDVLTKFNILKEQQKKIESEKMDNEQKKAELNLRYQYLNNFTYKSPNLAYYEQNKNSNFTIPLLHNNENNNLKNDINFGDNNKIEFNTFSNGNGIENGGKSGYINNYEKFNAEKYLKSVKNRIENGKRFFDEDFRSNGGKLDIAKEKEYLRKCRGNLDNNLKKI